MHFLIKLILVCLLIFVIKNSDKYLSKNIKQKVNEN